MSQTIDDFLDGKNAATNEAPSDIDAFLGDEKKDKGFIGHARDLGLSALKSAIAVPETAVGLADIPTGGAVGKFLENEGGAIGFRPKQAKEFLSGFHTDQYKAQQREFQEADGILDKTGVALQNPSLIANAVTESIAPMLAGGVGARGLMATTRLGQMGAKGAAAAGAIGEGATMAGSQAEAIRQETDSGLLTPGQSAAAAGTGLMGSVFGYAGGRLAQKLGIGDVDTMLARGITPERVAGELATAPSKSIPRQVVEGAIVEGFLEELPQSISEQIIQNLSLDKPWHEGVDEAAVMGTLAGMAMGGPAAGFSALTVDQAPKPSEQMGLDPSVGPMSNAAAKAVDAGAAALPSPGQLAGGLQMGAQVVPRSAALEAAADQVAADSRAGRTAEETRRAALDPSHVDRLEGTGSEFADLLAQERADLDARRSAPPWQEAKGVEAGFDPAARMRNQVPEQPRGSLSQVDDLAELIASERADLEQRRVQSSQDQQADLDGLVGEEEADVRARRGAIIREQRWRRAVETADADQRVADEMGREAAARRRTVLDGVLADPDVQDHAARFGAELGRQGYRDTAPTDDELRTIARFNDVLAAQPAGPEIEPSAPNELDAAALGIRERASQGTQPQQPQRPGFPMTQARAERQAAERSKATKEGGNLPPPLTGQGSAAFSPASVDVADQVRDAENMGASAPGATVSIDAAAHQAATSTLNDLPQPTDAQKAAGNYRKGHLAIGGLDVAIENPEGSTRSGVDPDGKPWSVEMQAHYGYVKRTEGADGDQVDVYLGRNEPTQSPVFVVDQYDARSGKFDEHKAILGAGSQKEAESLYDAHFSDGLGPQRRRAVTPMSFNAFKQWVRDGDTKKPVQRQEPATNAQTTEAVEAAAQRPQTPLEVANAPEPATLDETQGQASRPQGAPQDGAQEPGQRVGRTLEVRPSKLSAVVAHRTLRKAYPGAQLEVTKQGDDWAVVDLTDDPFTDSPANAAEGAMNRLAELQGMAQAAGWSERGGKLLRAEGDQGEVTGRTQWVPTEAWFAGKPAGVTERHMRSAVEKVASGRGILTKPERDGLAYMQDALRELESQAQQGQNEQAARLAELDALVEEAAAGLTETEVEAIRERLAMQMENATQEDYLQAVKDEIDAQARNNREAQQVDARGTGVRDAEGSREGRGEASAAPDEGFRLEKQTEQDLAARVAALETAERERQSEQKAADDKAKADAERDSFSLTGSDRPADVLAAQGQGGLFDARVEQRTKHDDYTQDLFANPVPAAPAVRNAAGVEPDPAENRNLFTAGLVPGARFATVAGPRQVAELKTAFERVESAAQAAHTLAGLRKNPQEHFAVLVLDAERRPLAVLQLFAGATTQASVYPEVVTKAVYEVPGAAHIWYAHNHPSGNAEPSNADALLTRALSQAFGEGTGVTVDGHAIIAGSRAIALDEEGFAVGSAFNIPPGLRRHTVKITERRFSRVGTLGAEITSPAQAKTEIPRHAEGKTGIVFANAQNGPVAFLPLSVRQMQALRDGKERSGARVLFGVVARSNASAAFVNFADNENPSEAESAVRNLYEALNGRDIRLLDAFQQGQSYAERGKVQGNGSGGVFFSLSGESAQTADTHALATAQQRIAAGEGAEAVRQETGWHKAADGRWRFEIDDSDASLKKPFPRKGQRWGDVHASVLAARAKEGEAGITLGDMLDHPALFAAYPRLAQLPVTTQRGIGASYAVGSATSPAEIGIGEDVQMVNVVSELLHEIQHGIQEIEGFARGGSPKTIEAQQTRDMVRMKFLESDPDYLAAVEWLDRREAEILDAGLDEAETISQLNALDPRAREMSPAYKEMAEARERLGRYGMRSPTDAYRALAGETEARNTQARQKLTAAERRATSPEATADVKASDVIVVFNGREMANAPAPANAVPPGITATAFVRLINDRFPKLAPAVRTMLERGMRGAKGGAVIINGTSDAEIARVFASKTGRSYDEALREIGGGNQFYSDAGDIQGFYDPDSGLLFMVGPNLTADTAPAVLLHEVTHGQRRSDIDARSLQMIERRAQIPMRNDVRAFLDRVARRMDDAGETGNANEATAYIVEQAVVEGRQSGFSAVDGKFLDWVDATFSKRIGDIVRDFVAMVRAWGLRHGAPIRNLAVDDLVALAQLGVKRAARGEVVTEGDTAEFSRAAMPGWLSQLPSDTQEAARKAGIWAPQKPLKDRLKDIRDTALKRVQQGLVDQFAPIKELGDREYVLARLTKSSDAPLEALLLYGKPFLNNAGAVDVNLEKGGLIGALQKLEGEHDRFFAWMAGNRAGQLKAEGRENLFTDTDISALKDLAQGTLSDGSSRAARYSSVKMQFNGYSKAVLDIAEKAVIINGADRAIWEKDFYVPFYRAMEDGEYKGPRSASGLVNQYAFKKLKGGTDNLADLMQNTLRNWSHLLSASLKNQAASAALDKAEAAGVAVPVSQKQKGSVSYLGKIVSKIPKGQAYVENGVQKVSDGMAEVETVGEKHFMVEDPFLLDAITSLEWAGWNNPAMKMMQKAKHYLTLGVTVSPTFKIRNLIRDQISAIGLNPMSYNLATNLAEGWKGTDKDSAQYAKMLAGGGLMRFGTFLEDDRAEHMKRLIQDGVATGTILDSKAKVKAMLSGAWDWWQDVGDRSENITRAAIYQQRYGQLVGEGKTVDEAHLLASFAARDSMDFSLQGQWGSIRFLTQLVPFMNARLQGLYKLGREGVAPSVRLLTGNEQAGDRERAIRFGAVTGTVALASIALFLAYRDDDDWKQREEWDRDAYWWFKVGDTAFRIPKPFEIGAIGTIAERGLETALNGLDAESRRIFLDRMGTMLTQTFSMNPIPQLFKPAIDLYANTDSFTGRPIETMGMERLSKAERIGPGTSATAQLLGKATSLVGLSPVQVDHLIDGYFSWLGSHAVMTTDFALRPLMGLPDKPARKWPDGYFIVGDFAKDLPSSQSKYVTQFYEQSKKVQEAMADIRYYQSLGQFEKAMELREDNADKLHLHGMYSAAERQISGINKRIRMVQMSSADADTKRDHIDRLTQARARIAEATETRRVALQ